MGESGDEMIEFTTRRKASRGIRITDFKKPDFNEFRKLVDGGLLGK